VAGWLLLGLLMVPGTARGLDYVMKVLPSEVGLPVWVDGEAVGSTSDKGLVLVRAEPGHHTVEIDFGGMRVSETAVFDPELNYLVIDARGSLPPLDLPPPEPTEATEPTEGIGRGRQEARSEEQRIDYLVETGVAGAAVYVDGDREATTDEAGRARIELIRGQKHRVEITKPGYRDFVVETVGREIGNYIEAEFVPRQESSNGTEISSMEPEPDTTWTGAEGGAAVDSRSEPRRGAPPGWLYGALVTGILSLVGVLGLVARRGRRSDAAQLAPAYTPGADGGVAGSVAGSDPEAGPRMPHIGDGYRVTELLKRGGQAEIFLAESLTADGVRYAVKMPLNADTLDDEEFEEFRREADQSRQLLNPHIITVYEAGKDETTRRPYYIMDYFPGPTLRELLRLRPPLPEVEALEQVVLPILYGLNYAHSRTPPVVHKDLKPENVLVRADDRGQIVDLKLIDFGLSFSRHQGAFPGTPPYVAPELFDGEDATPASDLFSLGVLTLELLTGKPPFFSRSVSEVKRKVLQGDYDVESLSTPAAAIVHKLLSPKRSERYQAAEEVILDCRKTLFSSRRAMTTKAER